MNKEYNYKYKKYKKMYKKSLKGGGYDDDMYKNLGLSPAINVGLFSSEFQSINNWDKLIAKCTKCNTWVFLVDMQLRDLPQKGNDLTTIEAQNILTYLKAYASASSALASSPAVDISIYEDNIDDITENFHGRDIDYPENKCCSECYNIDSLLEWRPARGERRTFLKENKKPITPDFAAQVDKMLQVLKLI